MSLIACNECQGKVSDSALACPHCGCPLPNLNEEDKNELKEKIELSKYRTLCGFFFFGGIAWIYFGTVDAIDKDAALSEVWQSARWFIGIGFFGYLVGEFINGIDDMKRKRKRKTH